jgi:hypothetical protein
MTKCLCERQVRPLYGTPNEKKPIWCSKCSTKPSNAVNVIGKKCKCGKIPNFNLIGETIGLY